MFKILVFVSFLTIYNECAIIRFSKLGAYRKFYVFHRYPNRYFNPKLQDISTENTTEFHNKTNTEETTTINTTLNICNTTLDNKVTEPNNSGSDSTSTLQSTSETSFITTDGSFTTSESSTTDFMQSSTIETMTTFIYSSTPLISSLVSDTSKSTLSTSSYTTSAPTDFSTSSNTMRTDTTGIQISSGSKPISTTPQFKSTNEYGSGSGDDEEDLMKGITNEDNTAIIVPVDPFFPNSEESGSGSDDQGSGYNHDNDSDIGSGNGTDRNEDDNKAHKRVAKNKVDEDDFTFDEEDYVSIFDTTEPFEVFATPFGVPDKPMTELSVTTSEVKLSQNTITEFVTVSESNLKNDGENLTSTMVTTPKFISDNSSILEASKPELVAYYNKNDNHDNEFDYYETYDYDTYPSSGDKIHKTAQNNSELLKLEHKTQGVTDELKVAKNYSTSEDADREDFAVIPDQILKIDTGNLDEDYFLITDGFDYPSETNKSESSNKTIENTDKSYSNITLEKTEGKEKDN